MSCSPEELKRKSDEFLAKWHSCTRLPSLDEFVEFAVTASSFTGFLDARGLSGLHQAAHALEQNVLSLIDQWTDGPSMTPMLHDLDRQIAAFLARVNSFLQEKTQLVTDRRQRTDAGVVADLVALKKVWLISPAPQAWAELVTQTGYLNIQVELQSDNASQPGAREPTIVLVDASGLEISVYFEEVQALRSRFSASNIFGLNLPDEFDIFRRALGAGCDDCFAVGTAQSVIMARVVQLCSNEQEPPYRVLVVEDSATASRLIQRTLREEGIESMAIDQPKEVLQALATFEPDLVLMDMYLPGCTGVEVTRVIRQHQAFLSTPVVYLSGDTSIALQVDALRLGGDHFLTKPFNPVVLNAVVKSKIERYRLLRRSMTLDSLTGLLNHSTSKQRLDALVQAALVKGANLCVAMIDIDHFKNVNDSYGHPMGDRVIRSLAWLLKQNLRNTDVVGRYGGEEFLVILPNAGSTQARQLLDTIRLDFARFMHLASGSAFDCSFSGGIAQLAPGLSSTALIKKADEALYRAKRQGRNQLALG
jgi:diguanylate cyclase (GGDEF)-like protein